MRPPRTTLYAGSELNYALRALAPMANASPPPESGHKPSAATSRRFIARWAGARLRSHRRAQRECVGLYRRVDGKRTRCQLPHRTAEVGPLRAAHHRRSRSQHRARRDNGLRPRTEPRAEDRARAPPLPRLDAVAVAGSGAARRCDLGADQRTWPISGVLVIARKGVREHLPFSITAAGGGRVPLSLPVDDSWVPSVQLRVVGVRPRKTAIAGPRSRACGRRFASITPTAACTCRSRRRRDRPRDSRADRRARARQPRSALSEVAQPRIALWAVDEAVLSLTNYQVPDPLPSFIPQADPGLHSHDEYSAILPPYSVEEDDPGCSSTYRA